MKDRDHYVGLMHVACRRLRHAIEVLDKDDQLAPEDNSTAKDLLDCQRIVNELVEELCPSQQLSRT